MRKRGKPAARQLTDRDQQIMLRIGEGGLLTFNQIKNLYWPEAKDQTAIDRLTQLVKAGYLLDYQRRLDPRPGQPPTPVYTLTKKGAASFEKLVQQRLSVGLPAAHEIKQQVLAQEARIKLEQQLAERGAKLLQWRNEHELRGDAIRQKMKNKRALGFGKLADIADAAATIQEADGTTQQLDIEIDGQYYGQMLKDKISKFGRGGKPVLWVSPSAARAERIQTEANQAGAENITVMALS